MNKDIEIRDAEIRELRGVNCNLFWLVRQGDYSNPPDNAGDELIIRAAKEGTTTAESAEKFIKSCEGRINSLQEHAKKRMMASREIDEHLKLMRAALKASLKLQANYAKLLNMHDGGNRVVFDSIDQWLRK